MKTAISLPDDLFEQVERFAHRAGRRRSEVYAAALREYVARHAPDEVTEALDRVVAGLDGSADDDAFLRRAADRLRKHAEW